MIFIVVIGGLGTIEGPILGAVVFFALQDSLADGAPGTSSCSGWSRSPPRCSRPRGLWGLPGRVELFPTGHRVGHR